MLKKIIAGLLVCTMAGSLMAGCGNNGGNGGSNSGKIALSVWHGGAEDTEETSNHQRYLKMAENFVAENPDYEVNVVGSVTAEKLMTAMSSGTGPDIGQPNWVHCGQWGTEGIIADLTDFVNNDAEFDKDDIIQAAWDRCSYKGKIYSIPVAINSSELYYNKDILDEAGVEAPKTINELVDLAINLTTYDDKGNITRAGYIPDYPWLDNVLWPVAFGAKWIDEDTNTITFDTPEMKAAYQWQLDIYNAIGYDKLMTFKTGLGTDAESPFITDKLALQFSGEWMFQDIEKYRPDMNYGVTYCPYPDGQPELEGSMFLTTTVWAMNNNSKNSKEDGWKLLSYLTNKENMKEMAGGFEDVGALLSRKSALDSLADSENVAPLKKEVAKMIQDPNVSGFPMSNYINEYLSVVADEMNKVFTPGSDYTLDQAAAKVQTEAQKLADANPVN